MKTHKGPPGRSFPPVRWTHTSVGTPPLSRSWPCLSSCSHLHTWWGSVSEATLPGTALPPGASWRVRLHSVPLPLHPFLWYLVQLSRRHPPKPLPPCPHRYLKALKPISRCPDSHLLAVQNLVNLVLKPSVPDNIVCETRYGANTLQESIPGRRHAGRHCHFVLLPLRPQNHNNATVMGSLGLKPEPFFHLSLKFHTDHGSHRILSWSQPMWNPVETDATPPNSRDPRIQTSHCLPSQRQHNHREPALVHFQDVVDPSFTEAQMHHETLSELCSVSCRLRIALSPFSTALGAFESVQPADVPPFPTASSSLQRP